MAMSGRDTLARVLAKPGFDADNYVSGLSQGGEDELLETKQSIQFLADDTAQSLKKNVYRNYSQFIETAKEISILEGEMYQLSHMLTDQKSRMSSMMEMSLTSDKAIVETPVEEKEQVNVEEETRRNLAFLLEKVEGCSTIADVPGRQLVHNGDLFEVDPEHYTQGRRVHAFLLNDSLMIANWLDIKHGPVRYRFEGLYELDSLAVVNVRDVGPLKNAFKILMFPHTRMFQTDSSKARRQWLDILEDTKKRKVARDKQRREMMSRSSEQQDIAKTPTSPERANPFDSEDEADSLVAMETDMLNVDWLQDLPEDLDMCIAQRDFEGSVDLVERVSNYLKDCPKTPAVKEFQARIDHRVKQLTEGLRSELQVSPERSLRGGPRAARRAVAQLIRLGKSAQACELFLTNRSAIIKYNIRQLKFEGATTLYIKRLCSGFFSSLADTGKEFTKAFPSHFGCYSAFVVWSSEELKTFVGIFSRQVFGGKSNVSTIADCVQIAREECAKLSTAGLDLGFMFDSMIADDVLRVIEESRDQLMEAVKYRANDDLWRPMNHMNLTMLNKFLEEMTSVGVVNIKNLVYDECWVNLTMNVALFAKSSLSFVDDMMKFMTPELRGLIIDSIVKLYRVELSHFQSSIKSDKFQTQHEFILKNADFIQQSLLLKTVKLLQQDESKVPKPVATLQDEFSKLKRMTKVS